MLNGVSVKKRKFKYQPVSIGIFGILLIRCKWTIWKSLQQFRYWLVIRSRCVLFSLSSVDLFISGDMLVPVWCVAAFALHVNNAYEQHRLVQSFIYQFDFHQYNESFEMTAWEIRLYPFSSSEFSKWKFQQNNVYWCRQTIAAVYKNFAMPSLFSLFRTINCDLSKSIRINWPEFLKPYSNLNTWNTRKLLIWCKLWTTHKYLMHRNMYYVQCTYISIIWEWNGIAREWERDREEFKHERNRLIWIKSCWWTIEICCCCAHALWDHKFQPTASESHTDPYWCESNEVALRLNFNPSRDGSLAPTLSLSLYFFL